MFEVISVAGGALRGVVKARSGKRSADMNLVTSFFSSKLALTK